MDDYRIRVPGPPNAIDHYCTADDLDREVARIVREIEADGERRRLARKHGVPLFRAFPILVQSRGHAPTILNRRQRRAFVARARKATQRT